MLRIFFSSGLANCLYLPLSSYRLASDDMVTTYATTQSIRSNSNLAIRHISLALLTYTVSWLLDHTAFALHYPNAYYLEFEKTKSAPLLFEAKLRPLYIDFLNFSMVIGMTCQTADVSIANSRMKFWAMIQGATAFIFNTSLPALAMHLILGAVLLQ